VIFESAKLSKKKTSDNLKPITKAVSIIFASTCLNEILVRYDSKPKLIAILTIVSLLFVNFVGPPMNQFKLTKYLQLWPKTEEGQAGKQTVEQRLLNKK
jgi:hypothetical protein